LYRFPHRFFSSVSLSPSIVLFAEPIDVLEMLVTPRGEITAQRLKRAADFLSERAQHSAHAC